MAVSGAEVEKRLSVLATVLGARSAEVSRDVSRHILARVPQLGGDTDVLGLLRSSVSENVVTLLHIFEHGVAVRNTEAPVAALEYARRLAQRDIAMSALVRAYRLGHLRFLRWCLDELDRECPDEEVFSGVNRRLLDVSFGYIDTISEQVVEAYQGERNLWLMSQAAARTGRVREILVGEQVDPELTESVLGYRLRQHHVGLVLWAPERSHGRAAMSRLDRLIGMLAAALDLCSGPLFVARDEALAWAWLPLGGRREVPWQLLTDTAEDGDRSVRMCAGDVEYGIDGFRRTHRQALRARDMALAAAPGHRVTLYSRVAPVALMCQDIDELRAWVWSVLGELATDDDHCALLRETVQIFLATGCSYTATAHRQILHKNTVQYRISKAEEAMGQSVHERRTDLGVALLACQYLGPPVLRAEAS
ncbi:helix-turn-helix domain-containing protein [Streptomyces sp. NPDC005209]|uniref:PucR family transcriptional regulator n=1 Tax=Streptomyces sp. NPDC005209 TaxID=3156715 RepID=UPI0033ADDAE7